MSAPWLRPVHQLAIAHVQALGRFLESLRHRLMTGRCLCWIFPTAHEQAQAQSLLEAYLAARIRFYQAASAAQRLQSIHRQTQLWQLVSDIAKQSPNSLSMPLADACNQLYTSQQETMASWRQQIPMAAWLMVMVFGVFSNFLIGYHMPAGSWGWLLIVPFVTALALFMIAEIDVPGKGVIHVTPQNLQALRTVISGQGLIP